ncbi:MAG: hypothetical protein ACI9LN_000551 [Saprospiraceae bacterium]|jgi:hypothetical protein
MKAKKRFCLITKYLIIGGLVLLNNAELRSQDFQEIAKKLNGKYDLPCHQSHVNPEEFDCSIEEGFTKIKIDITTGKGFMSENIDGTSTRIWDLQITQEKTDFWLSLKINNSQKKGLLINAETNGFTLSFEEEKISHVYYLK